MTIIPDPDHPGFYLTGDPGVTADPADPDFYLTIDPGIIPDPDHPGFYVINDIPAEPIVLDATVSSSTVTVDIFKTSILTPLKPAVIAGATSVAINLIAGGDHIIELDPIESTTEIRILSYPTIGSNTPILLAFSAQLRIESSEPLSSVKPMSRAVAGIVVTLPEPAVSDGHPSLPDQWARFSADATLIEGPTHIHAIPDPNPIWDPRTSGWTFPPGASAGGAGVAGGDLRWTVDSLPNPGGFSKGWYWLGDPDGRDGTGSIPAACRQWPCAVPGGPTWNSFYPFKPSVNSYNGYIVGERNVHHPKGVHFNSHYAEHMWIDMGNQSQPFTWIVVATVMSDPFGGYQHHILDSGRNPDACRFPRIGANFSERWIQDSLSYRTGLISAGDTASMFTKSEDAPLRARGAGGHHPRMFAGVYDGDKSLMASYDPFGKNISQGRVSNQSPHRYMVIGREQGWISQRRSSNILVLEIRYWRHALTRDDLEAQYAQLSSTHQFDAYKSL